MVSFRWGGSLTARIPKIAPEAPTEGIPGRAKFPPRTLLWVPSSVPMAIRGWDGGDLPENTSGDVGDKKSGGPHFLFDLQT